MQFQAVEEGTMNTADIQFALKSKLGNEAIFYGCVSSDSFSTFKIPPFRKKPLIFSVNTLPSYKYLEMGHWTVFVIQKSPLQNIVFFDPLGMEPEVLSSHFSDFMKNNSDMTFFRNYNAVQHINSAFCAFFCLYFTHYVSLQGVCRAIWKMKMFI